MPSGSRTLRIQCGDKLFDWFDVDEEQDIISAPDVLKILKENVAHYFKVAVDAQILFDETGVIATTHDLRRSFKVGGKPRVMVAEQGKLNADQNNMYAAWLAEMERVVAATPKLSASVSKTFSGMPMRYFSAGAGAIGDAGRARSLTPQVRAFASRGVSPQPGSLIGMLSGQQRASGSSTNGLDPNMPAVSMPMRAGAPVSPFPQLAMRTAFPGLVKPQVDAAGNTAFPNGTATPGVVASSTTGAASGLATANASPRLAQAAATSVQSRSANTSKTSADAHRANYGVSPVVPNGSAQQQVQQSGTTTAAGAPTTAAGAAAPGTLTPNLFFAGGSSAPTGGAATLTVPPAAAAAAPLLGAAGNSCGVQSAIRSPAPGSFVNSPFVFYPTVPQQLQHVNFSYASAAAGLQNGPYGSSTSASTLAKVESAAASGGAPITAASQGMNASSSSTQTRIANGTTALAGQQINSHSATSLQQPSGSSTGAATAHQQQGKVAVEAPETGKQQAPMPAEKESAKHAEAGGAVEEVSVAPAGKTVADGEQVTTEATENVFVGRKQIALELEKAETSDRFGFSSVPFSSGGLEITRVDRGGLLAQWNTVRRAGGPAAMVGVGDVIMRVNDEEEDEAMRAQLETTKIAMLVAKMRL